MPETNYYGDLNLQGNKVKNVAAASASGELVRYDEFNALVRNQTAEENLYLGETAGSVSSTGTKNVFIGKSAGPNLTSGANNAVLGAESGNGITTGGNNTLLGGQAGKSLTTQSDNVFVGYQAGVLATADGNVFIGSKAGVAATTATKNVFIGRSAGANATTGSGNVVIGNNAALSSATDSNKLVIANDSTDAATLLFGDFSTGKIGIKRSAVDLDAALNLPGGLTFVGLAADVTITSDGVGALWVSDGTGTGSAGDLVYSYKSGGTQTNYIISKTAA